MTEDTNTAPIKSSTPLIDPLRRLIRVDDALSASIVTGTDKVQSGYGNGDCLLMDFPRGVFAVADAAERFPVASRDLLERLVRGLTTRGAPGTRSEWTACIEEAWAGQKFVHKTTFSLLALSRRDDGLNAYLCHGGDSAIMIFDAADQSIKFKTGPDMNFAGRSKQAPAVEKIPLENRNLRILLATDGFFDVIRHYYGHCPLGLPEELLSHPVHRAAGLLHRAIEESRGKLTHDDIGLILLDPFKAENIEHPPLLMGGTTPDAEANYIKYLEEKASPETKQPFQQAPDADLPGIAGIKKL